MKQSVDIRILAGDLTFRKISYIAVNVFAAAKNGQDTDRQLNIFCLQGYMAKPGDIVIIDTDFEEHIPGGFVVKALERGFKALLIVIYADVSEIPRFMPLEIYAVVWKRRLEVELMEILTGIFLRD